MLVFFLLVSCASVIVNAENDDVSHCPPGMKLYADEKVCLEYHSEPATQVEAKAACQEEGGAHLVFIKSNAKLTEVATLLTDDPTVQFWHGVKYNTDALKFKYLDGSDLDDGYKPWVGVFGIDECSTVMTDDPAQSWFYKGCEEKHGYVCERSAVTCEKNWIPDESWVTDLCFKVVKKFKKPFTKSNEYCKKSEAQLVTTGLMTREVTRKLTKKTRGRMVWVGIHDPNTDEKWTFVGQDSPIPQDGLDKLTWKRMFPKDPATADQRCVMMKKRKLSSRKCKKRLPFICEKLSII